MSGWTSFAESLGWSLSNERNHVVLGLFRLASHQVWGGASDESEEEDDELAVDSKVATPDQAQRSGKLLVLQQILPLWHAQV